MDNRKTNQQKDSWSKARYELTPDDINKIQTVILSDDDAKLLVEFANEKARKFCNSGLTTNQLRNVFGEIRKIETFWKNSDNKSRRKLQLMIPKLAYQKAREKDTAYFCDFMTKAIGIVLDEQTGNDIDKKFNNFMNLLESIVAYHRLYSEKK